MVLKIYNYHSRKKPMSLAKDYGFHFSLGVLVSSLKSLFSSRIMNKNLEWLKLKPRCSCWSFWRYVMAIFCHILQDTNNQILLSLLHLIRRCNNHKGFTYDFSYILFCLFWRYCEIEHLKKELLENYELKSRQQNSQFIHVLHTAFPVIHSRSGLQFSKEISALSLKNRTPFCHRSLRLRSWILITRILWSETLFPRAPRSRSAGQG